MRQFFDRNLDVLGFVLLIGCATGLGIYFWVLGTKTKSESQRQQVRLQMQTDRITSSKPTRPNYRAQPLINQRYAHVLVEQIKQARDTIDVAMFLIQKSEFQEDGFGPSWVLDALKSAMDRGVEVKMLLGKQGNRSPARASEHLEILEQLEHPRFEGYVYPHRRKLHAKMVLIDDDLVLTGAHNWTWHSLNKSHETSFLLEADRPVDRLSDRFRKLWDESSEYYEEQEEGEDV